MWVLFFFFLILSLFLGCAGSLAARAFSRCAEQGPLLIAVRGLLTAAAPLVAELRLRCSTARGVFPDWGQNPYLLHWKADS